MSNNAAVMQLIAAAISTIRGLPQLQFGLFLQAGFSVLQLNIDAVLCYACCAEPSSELHCRPASPSLSSKSRLSSSSVPEAVPFAIVTNTPASRAPAAAAPASQDDSHAAFGGKGAASREASRRRSQGLENLQEQLQGVMMEGNQIQVRHVPPKQLLLLLLLLLLLHQCSLTQ